MASENNEYPDLVIVGAGLFARQMKTVGNMTRNALLSWQALLERAVRAIINGSTLTDRERMVLHRVNTRHAWWANDLSLPWVENGDGGLRPCTMRTRNMLLLPVPAYLLKLSRRIVTHAITRTPIPDLSHVRTLVLDAIIAKPERPHAHTDTRFGWWIRVATLTKGKPVLIPVDRNEYFEQQYAHAIKHGGGLCGVIQLTRHDNGTLSCALVLDRPDAPMRMDGKPLGIDYGMADALMADSDGNLMGHAMLATLKRYDLRLTQLGAWLQRRHIKPSTNHEYRRLQHRIRAYVANEIGRILNRVAARPVLVRSNTRYTPGVTCADCRCVSPDTGRNATPGMSLTACSFFNASTKSRNRPAHGEDCESNRFCTTHSIGSAASYPVMPASSSAWLIAETSVLVVFTS